MWFPGYQSLVLVVAWLGWVFDSTDATIYALVMSPALKVLGCLVLSFARETKGQEMR